MDQGDARHSQRRAAESSTGQTTDESLLDGRGLPGVDSKLPIPAALRDPAALRPKARESRDVRDNFAQSLPRQHRRRWSRL